MKKFKKIMALVLTFCMAFSMLSFSSFATNDGEMSDEQIVYAGGTTTGDNVVISKTIDGTGIENVFDITLDVNTSESLAGKAVSVAPDAAVSLVVDVSRTMAFKYINGSSCKEYDKNSRLNVAKRVMLDFLNSYAASGKDDEGNQIAHRWVSLVGFGGQAWNYLYAEDHWVDVATDEGMAKMESILSYISSSQVGKKTVGAVLGSGNKYLDWSGTVAGEKVDYTNGYGNGGTNIEAGLMLANNLWDAGFAEGGKIADVEEENCWTVMLSDGEPTMYVTKDDTSSTSYIYGISASSSSTINQTDYVDVPKQATAIKEHSTLEIIAMGNDNWLNSKKKWDLVNNTTCGNWLASLSTDGTINKPGSAESDLAAAFSELYGTIARELSYMSTEAWMVTDPMGEDIEFLGFYDKEGNYNEEIPAQLLAGTYTEGGEDTAFVDENGTISWDLKASGYAKDGDNSVFTIKYRVRLATETEGFEFDKECAANGNASLTYQTVGIFGYSKEKTIEFKVPTVKGLVADMSFYKTDAKRNALEGAEFSLVHSADCACGETLATTGTYTVTGNTHSFATIPSGHSYTLLESVTPEGYVNEEGNREITVDMGQVVATPVFNVDTDGNWYVVNTMKDDILNGDKTAKLVDKYENRWEVEVKVPASEKELTSHDEVIIMVDGSYSGNSVWPKTREAILEVGAGVLNGTGDTQLTLMTFGMSDNIVVAGIKSVKELDEKLTEVPGGLLYGRSSTNCEAGFTGIAKYIESKGDELDKVHVIYISDGGINTDETPFVYGAFDTYTWLPNRIGNLQYLLQCALEFSLYKGIDAPATIDIFGSNDNALEAFAAYAAAKDNLAANETTMTEEVLAANTKIVNEFETNVYTWGNKVFKAVYDEAGLTIGEAYPISVVEDAFVTYDKINKTYIREAFYYTSYGRTYPDSWSRTPQAATALAAMSKVEHLYMVDNNAASGWMNPEYSTDPTVSVQGSNVSFTYNANVTNLSAKLNEILVEVAKTPINDVYVTDYMSKWVSLDPETLKIVDNITDETIWTAADGWLIDEDIPTVNEPPVVVELVDPADYAAGGADVVGNTNGDIYKLTWHVKDGALLRSDNYSLVYEVIVDVEEENFEYKIDLPSNGNTNVHYKDGDGDDQSRPIEVPDVNAEEKEIKYFANPNFAVDENGNPTETLIQDPYKEIEDGDITMNKTVEQLVEEQNGYNVTLKVSTEQDLREVEFDTDVALTLMFDVSGSMLFCDECGGGEFSNPTAWAAGERGEHNEGCSLADQPLGYEISRMKPAIESTVDFLEDYADSSSGGKRMISIVFFYKHAHLVMDWADLTDEEQLAKAIETIEGSVDWAGSYTCQDAAMRLADAQFDKDAINDITNRYAVMVTDGNPTAYYLSTDADTGVYYGKANYTQTVLDFSKEAADLLKDNGNVEFYTLAYAVDGVAVSKVDDRLVGEWLEQDIATDEDHALNAKNGEEIKLTFGIITEKLVEGASLYTVVDPMGEYVDYVELVSDSECTSFDAATETVTWNLLKEVPTEVIEEDGSVKYVYTLTYKVVLDIEKEGFEFNTLYPANKATSLTYVMIEPDGSVDLDSEIKTAWFNIPGVLAKVLYK